MYPHGAGSNSDDYERSDWGSLADDKSFWAPPTPSVSLPRGGACHPTPPGGLLAPTALVGPTAPTPPGGLLDPTATVGPAAPGGPPPPPSLGPRLDTLIPLPVDWFTLPPIKSGDDYLCSCNLILFWLCTPGFSTALDDSVLMTDGRNLLASQYWEGQLRTSLKDGPVWFLFKNTGSTFYGKGFKILQVLEDNFRPSSISNTFTTLLALFNTTQGDKEGLHEFCLHFEGHLAALSQSLVAIPPIPQVMLFLHALHSRCHHLLTQFASKQKDLASANIDSVVADAQFMDEFIVVDVKSKPSTPGASPHAPAAASVATDKDGKEYRTTWEWLASYNLPGILARWRCSLRGGFYCTFCHSNKKHHPTKCPFLAELGLKLIIVGGKGSSGTQGTPPGGPAAGGPPAGGKPLPATPSAAPAETVSPPATTPGSSSAPTGLTAAVIKGADGDESSTDSFHWYGDEEGLEFKSNNAVSPYLPPRDSASFPSCCQASVGVHAPLVSSTAPLCSVSEWTPSGDDIILPPALIWALSQAISLEDLSEALRLVVADTRATDHMLPNRLAFISYKSVRNLRVQMGNNSYASVLGCGTAIISLNKQRLLIRNVLHVLALCVPLYSLWAHLHQPGCGFVGSHDTGMHVYFPGVVLSVDMSTNCHLSYAPLVKSAPFPS
jgi:hypothetical protein